MKHHTFEELRSIGVVEKDFPHTSLSRSERLERWAELLEQVSHHQLATLYETEHQSIVIRAAMRADNSPISVAFKDPVLRSAGMESDTYEEARRFFEMSDEQLHRVVCFCHFGLVVSGAEAARRVRDARDGRPGLFSRLRALFMH